MKKGAAVKKKSGSSGSRSRSTSPVPRPQSKFPQMSKNGWELPVFVISIAVVALAVIMLSKAPIYGPSGNVISGGAVTGYAPYAGVTDSGAVSSGVSSGYTDTGSSTTIAQSLTWNSLLGTVSKSSALINSLQYLFGQPIQVTGSSAFSGAIITIALWLILFLTFADIINTFSTFSPWVSWIVGFLLAVVAANIGVVTQISLVSVRIFAVFGTLAVWLGLGGAFFAFIVVNLGLTFMGKWVLKRRALMAASTAEAGGEKLSGTIAGLEKVGEAMEKWGRKKGK